MREILEDSWLQYIYLEMRLPDAEGVREEPLGSCESALCLGMNNDDMGSFLGPLVTFTGEGVDCRSGS